MNRIFTVLVPFSDTCKHFFQKPPIGHYRKASVDVISFLVTGPKQMKKVINIQISLDSQFPQSINKNIRYIDHVENLYKLYPSIMKCNIHTFL